MDSNEFRTKKISEIKEFAEGKKLDNQSVDELISSLRIVKDRVASFKYITMKERLSENDCQTLIKIIGFDPAKNRDFDNCECSHGQCVSVIGHACDPVACRG
jgi:hypothetical protein